MLQILWRETQTIYLSVLTYLSLSTDMRLFENLWNSLMNSPVFMFAILLLTLWNHTLSSDFHLDLDLKLPCFMHDCVVFLNCLFSWALHTIELITPKSKGFLNMMQIKSLSNHTCWVLIFTLIWIYRCFFLALMSFFSLEITLTKFITP